jgi:esterase
MPVTLYFRKTGQGPVLLILHGLFGSSDNWMTISKKLEADFTVIIPDLRNHGQSPHTLSHTFEDMTNDLELFFSTQHIEQASVLGHSMGGKAAMMFAANNPNKVNNLIIADIAPKSYKNETGITGLSGQNELILDLMEKTDLTTVSTRQEIDQFLSSALPETGLRQFIIKNVYRDSNGLFKWKINLPVLRDSLEKILKDVNQEWFSDRKPILNYPVTFIRGLKSGYILDSDIPTIKNIYPEAHIIDIPDAGHWVHADQPERFVEAVRNSLQRNQ